MCSIQYVAWTTLVDYELCIILYVAYLMTFVTLLNFVSLDHKNACRAAMGRG